MHKTLYLVEDIYKNEDTRHVGLYNDLDSAKKYAYNYFRKNKEKLNNQITKRIDATKETHLPITIQYNETNELAISKYTIDKK